METLIGLAVGIGLSAACGFRVFVPMLGLSIASMSGHFQLAPAYAWIGTWPALIAFATAAAFEVGAYYIPWVDNLLDTITTPAAIMAGTLVTASSIGDTTPLLKWTLAAVAGGGVAGVVQFGTATLRGASSALTGGLGNFVLSTIELVGAILMTVCALMLPLIGLLVVAMLCALMFKRMAALPYFNRGDSAATT